MQADVVETAGGWKNPFGFFAMVFGGGALLLVLVHMWAAPLAPQKSIERSIAEVAVNVAKEVVNVARNKPAALKARGWTIDDTLRISAAVIAVVSLVLAAVGFVRREDRRLVAMGAALGASAIAFQFLIWLALLICGLVFLWIVVTNLGDILSV